MTEAAKDFFAGKKVTQLGLGLLGRGVRDAAFLAQHCAEVVVTDRKSAADLAESVDRLKVYSNITYRLGEHVLADFEQCDFILKGAGVPLHSAEIAHARTSGVPVYMDEALFLKLAPETTMIGVTGTRGKTTTTMLIHHIVSEAYKNKNQNVFLAGNIKDVATLPLLEEVSAGDTVVAELSSWQLQGFCDIAVSPHISVFTNFLPDHLNYYDGDMAAYFADKACIFAYQTKDDVLICTPQAEENIKRYYAGAIMSKVCIADAASPEMTPFITASPMVGEHNAENIACAASACKEFGIEDAVIIEAIKTFNGAPGRMQFVGTKNGVSIFNDTTSTTPDALRAALLALQDRKPILIMGGADKGLDFSAVYELIAAVTKAVFITPGNGSARISKDVETACVAAGIPCTMAASTADAVEMAQEQAKEGDTILFSPGFASFSEFKNEFDRGDQFDQFINQVFSN